MREMKIYDDDTDEKDQEFVEVTLFWNRCINWFLIIGGLISFLCIGFYIGQHWK